MTFASGRPSENGFVITDHDGVELRGIFYAGAKDMTLRLDGSAIFISADDLRGLLEFMDMRMQVFKSS